MSFVNECKRFNLRLRPDVYEAVRRSAADNFRSMTAEINELLLEATKKAPGAYQANPDASEGVKGNTTYDE